MSCVSALSGPWHAAGQSLSSAGAPLEMCGDCEGAMGELCKGCAVAVWGCRGAVGGCLGAVWGCGGCVGAVSVQNCIEGEGAVCRLCGGCMRHLRGLCIGSVGV